MNLRQIIFLWISHYNSPNLNVTDMQYQQQLYRQVIRHTRHKTKNRHPFQDDGLSLFVVMIYLSYWSRTSKRHGWNKRIVSPYILN